MRMNPRRLISLFLVIVLLSPARIPETEAAPLPFPDMEWSFYRYKEAVQFLKDRRVIQGNPDGNFRPKDGVNRAEFLKMLFTGDHDIVDPDRRCFSDINPREWYAAYVCTAKLRTIVKGYPDGTFQPGQAMNWAEAIKMAMRVHGMEVTETGGADWYKPYVEKLDTEGILAAHSFVPWETVTRERAADLLWRMIRYKEERVVPRLSEGCGKAEATIPTSVTVFDMNRTFLVTKPRNYVVHDPSPLVIAFHGRTNNNEQVRNYMKLDRELTDSFIVYPAAISNGNGSFSWASPGDPAQKIRDIAFFDDIVETFAKNFCIDMDRISVVGHSLGAWMANTVACVRGDIVLASATVGGDSVFTDCNGPAAAFIAHSPQDRLAPFSGAERVRDMRMEENQCNSERPTPGPTALNCTTYPICAGGNRVLFCPHEEYANNGGSPYYHTWPNETAGEIKKFLQSLD